MLQNNQGVSEENQRQYKKYLQTSENGNKMIQCV